ncbi:MAG: hypothetical protein KGH77_02060 [Candidatus Micrarchaeota archaeon]|nr:hypothetical protein [Candidatus Micrarchaeota archaeon]
MKEFADLVPGSYDKQNSNKELPDSWMGLGSSSWSTPSQVFHWGYDDYGYVTCAGILLNRNYELAHFLVKSASAWIEIKNKPSEVEDFLKEQGKDYTKLKQRVLAGKGWLSKNLRE